MAKYMREKSNQHNFLNRTGAGQRFNNMRYANNKFKVHLFMVAVSPFNERLSFQDYGVSGDACDFSMFMGFQSGTSFSAPFLAGMIGLLKM